LVLNPTLISAGRPVGIGGYRNLITKKEKKGKVEETGEYRAK